MTNKLPELAEVRKRHLPHLIALTETWFQPYMSDNELEITGMSLLRHDRTSRGGGVAIYYDKHLLCREITDADLILEDTLWCSIRMVTGEDCIVGVIYRPPSTRDADSLNILDKIRLVASRHQQRLLIMGDFNLPNLLRSHTHSVNSLESVFQQLLHELPLYNHVSNYTRYRGTDTPSILDLVLTSEENVIDSLDYDTPLGLSDHIVLIFDYVCHAERSSDASKMIRKVDLEELSNALRDITDWNLDSSDLQENWSRLIKKLHDNIESHS